MYCSLYLLHFETGEHRELLCKLHVQALLTSFMWWFNGTLIEYTFCK